MHLSELTIDSTLTQRKTCNGVDTQLLGGKKYMSSVLFACFLQRLYPNLNSFQ